MRRAIVALGALVAPILFGCGASWATCQLAPVEPAALATELARLAEPPRAASMSGWWRARALLPARVSVSRNEGVTLGLGEVLGTTGAGSERTSTARSAGLSVRLVWDLRPLLAPPPQPKPNDALQRALQTEQLSRRIAALLARQTELAALAAGEQQGEPPCDALQAEQRGLLALLAATLGTTPSRLRRAAPLAPPRAGAR